ncbi:MAG: PEP-CTERM sorting domain-containing protein [Myxococcota bacterium]
MMLRPSISYPPSLIFAGAFLIASAESARSASFDLIWDFGGEVTYTEPNAISADGSTVVGELRTSAGQEAFVWDRERGLRGIGDLPGGSVFSIAENVSGDGSVVAGNTNSASGSVAFIWDEDRGMRELDPLPEGFVTTIVGGISDDGSTVVGTMYSEDGRRSDAYFWNETAGYRSIATLPDGTVTYGGATDTNRDGSVIVGGAEGQAFVWTEDDGMILLGDLLTPPRRPNSVALAVSQDGSVVVGPASGPSPFIWDADQGLRALYSSALPPEIFSFRPSGASGDASVVVGGSFTPTGNEATIWTQAGGLQFLRVVLATMGVDLDGWSLLSATDVSADGRTIVGFASKQGFASRGYIVVIPEPGTGVLVMIGLAILATAQRHAN